MRITDLLDKRSISLWRAEDQAGGVRSGDCTFERQR